MWQEDAIEMKKVVERAVKALNEADEYLTGRGDHPFHSASGPEETHLAELVDRARMATYWLHDWMAPYIDQCEERPTR